MNAPIKGLGWKPDLPDIRDFNYTTRGVIKKEQVLATTHVDLRLDCPPVYDQEDLGSCTAQAVSSVFQYLLAKQLQVPAKNLSIPSRLFLYYVTRDRDGTALIDSGATLRNTIKAVNEVGVCVDDYWPYIVEKFKERPEEVAYHDAELRQALTYARVPQNLNSMKAVLAEGFPFVFGFSVYDALYTLDSDLDWILPLPGGNDSLFGGHAVTAVGFNDEKQVFIIRNSWGVDWGVHGYFYMPYSYILNPRLAQDFWTIRSVELSD